MIASTSPQPWIFYSPLTQQAVLLQDDWLDPVDELWDDPALIELVRQCLAKRSLLSTRTGRDGIALHKRFRTKPLRGKNQVDVQFVNPEINLSFAPRLVPE